MKNLSSIRLISVSLLLLLAAAIPGNALESTKELETIARLTGTIVARQHFRQHPIDDEISAKLYEQYLKALDPNKIYFSKEDLAKFEPSKLSLDEQLSTGNLAFAFSAYNELIKKVAIHRDYAAKMLSQGLDFSVEEEYAFDRSEAPWAANQKELEELWRKKLKNEVLTIRLMRRAEKEEKNTAEKENTENQHPSWNNKTPEEIILKRIDQYSKYLEKNNPIDVLEIYLSSLAMVYDPHSSYMSPTSEEDFNISMRLSLVGIGAVLSSEDGYTKIESVVPGGPADLDGRLKPGDRIIAVTQPDSEPVDIIDMPLNRVVRMIRGTKNTKVTLTFLKGSKGASAIPETVTITRDTVKLTDQEASGRIQEIKSNGTALKVGIIILPSFYMDFDAAQRGDKDFKSSTRDVKKLLENFRKEKVDAVLLDMRSNGGGSLVEAINLSGLFIKSGPVVQVRTNPGNVDIKCDEDEEQSYDGPLLVLVNRLSASATEIFAGAIKDYERGIIVGDSHTHGKGTVQTIWELNQFLAYLGAKFPAGSVKFTNAMFFRINGASTQIKGVTPDISFPAFTDSMKIGEEDLDHALPWSEIAPVKHDIYNANLEKLVPELKNISELRRKNNKKFALLEKDIEIYKRLRDRKTISLCESVRWADYLKEKKLLEEQNRLIKLDDESPKKASAKKGGKRGGEDDIYLEESLNILGDLVRLSGKAAAAPVAAATK